MSKRRNLCFAFVVAAIILSVALPAFGQNNRNTNGSQVQRRDPGNMMQGRTLPMAQTKGDRRARVGNPYSNVTPDMRYRTQQGMGSGSGQYEGQWNSGQQNAASGLHQTPNRRFEGQNEGAWGAGSQLNQTEARGAWRQGQTEQGANRRLTVDDQWWNDEPSARTRSAPMVAPSAVNRRPVEPMGGIATRTGTIGEGFVQPSRFSIPNSAPRQVTERIEASNRLGQSFSGFRIENPANRAIFNTNITNVNITNITNVTNIVNGYRGSNRFGSSFILGPRYPIGERFFRPPGWEYCSGFRYNGFFINLNFGPAYDGILVNSAAFVPVPWYYNMDDGSWYDEAGQAFAYPPVLAPEVPIGVLVPVWIQTGYGARRVLILENAGYLPGLRTYGWWNSFGGGFGRLGFEVRTRNVLVGAAFGY
jgi:hypothetical protein